jgi:hypothetical protein
MGDGAYEKEYLERKKKLRLMHKKLKNSKEIQEIYHNIMGSTEGVDDTNSNDDDL